MRTRSRSIVAMAVCLLLGCGPVVSAPLPASSTTHAVAPNVDAETGSELASVVAVDGAVDAPHEWVPEVPGIFPPRATQLSDTWNFASEIHCRTAEYEGDFALLRAEHAKFSELVSVLEQAPKLREVESAYQGARMVLMRDATTFEGPQPALSVCTPLPMAKRVAITTAILRQIPALRGHEPLLSEGAVEMVGFDFDAASHATFVDAWLVGDDGARHAWETLLRSHGLAKGEKLESTSDKRSYGFAPRGSSWEFHLHGDL